MSIFADPRFVFVATILLIPINCNPALFTTPPFSTDFDVDVYLRRFSGVAETIKGQDQLGYIADQEKTRVKQDGQEASKELDLTAFRMFFITQYKIAPKVLLHDETKKVIIGNFSTAKLGMDAAKSNHLKIVKDCGNGVFVFERGENEGAAQ